MITNLPISNGSLFGAQTDAERYGLVAYSALTLIINVLGNIFILVSSVKYKSIKMDAVSVVLIQNIAISDIAVALNTINSTLASLLANGWIFGR